MKTKNTNSSTQKNKKLTVYELTEFALLGAIMFCSKKLMESIPNIHLVGMLTMTFTLAFRKKALFPLYIYVLLDGLFGGFNMWWYPYLYIWTILWGVTMLLPKHMKKKTAVFIYSITCGLHGLAFGTLYSPVQALMMGMDFNAMVAWIVAGLPYDLIHGAGNVVLGIFILPLSEFLRKLNRRIMRQSAEQSSL